MTATAGPLPDARRFEVRAEDRLDRAVSIAVPSLSRTQARRWVEEGRVRVDGARVTGDHNAANGVVVSVDSVLLPN